MDKHLQTLTHGMLDIWNNGFLGVDVGRFLTAFAIFAGFLMLRGLISRYILGSLQRWCEKHQDSVAQSVVTAVKPPVETIPILLGIFFALTYSGLDAKLGALFAPGVKTVITFVIFWILFQAIGPLSRILRGLEQVLSPTVVRWIFSAARIFIAFLGAAIVLEFWGISLGPLLAGLGIFGAAVALGAQDMFKNLIAGLAIIAEKRFHPGEWVKINDVAEGIVEQIGFRSTTIRRFDRAPVHLPNAQIADVPIVNFGRMTGRRITCVVSVRYDTSVKQLALIRDKIQSHLLETPDFLPPEQAPCLARVDAFSPSSIDILVRCFTRTTDWVEWMAIKEKLILTIKDIVEKDAGAAFAFPSQSVYIEKADADKRIPAEVI